MTDSEQNAPPKREVVVVLGVGRSGTSLAMQALESLGVRVSQNLIPPNVSNPKGFYEDADIVEIHKHLLSTLALSPAMPLENGWMNTPEAKQALKQLKEIVEANVSAGEAPWAFKDPRTATFLPLWIRLFNQLKIVPRFVLAVRRPEAVIVSFAQQYANDQAFAELIYLQRTLDALHYTGNDCHILPYERWFEKPGETLQALASFVFEDGKCADDVEPPISRTLNRSTDQGVRVNNPLVIELMACIDEQIDDFTKRDLLVECVRRQRAVLEAFRPLLVLAEGQKKLNRQCRDRLKEVEARMKLLGSVEVVVERQELAANQFIRAFQALDRLEEVLN